MGYDWKLLSELFSKLGKLIRSAANIQRDARNELRESLEKMCRNYESANDKMRSTVNSIRDEISDEYGLERTIRTLASYDSENAQAIRELLYYGAAPALLDRLRSWLDTLRYSIDVRLIKELKSHLYHIQSADFQVYDKYSDLIEKLLRFAQDYEQERTTGDEFKNNVQRELSLFESKLSKLLNSIREVSRQIRY